MERFCVTHERDRGLGCDVEMVQSNVGEYVRFEDAQAEIAKLKSDLTKAHQDGYAEGRKHRVAAVETHADEMYRAQEEIAKLRVDLDQARRDRNSAVECAEVLRGYVAAHKADLAAARAALKVEREACDRFWASGTTTRDHTDEAESVIDEDWFWGEWNAHKQRRATEAITVPPNRTGTREESQAIADWHHDEINRRAAEAKDHLTGVGKMVGPIVRIEVPAPKEASK